MRILVVTIAFASVDVRAVAARRKSRGRSSVLAVINHVRHVRHDCEPMSTLNEIRDLCGHGVYSI